MTAAICELVEDDGTVLVDFTDRTGLANPHGLGLYFATDHELDLGSRNAQVGMIDRSGGGGDVTDVQQGLMQMKFGIHAEAATIDDLQAGLAEVGWLLEKGGRRLRFALVAGAEPGFIPLQPSPYLSQVMGRHLFLDREPPRLSDIPVVLNRQPWTEYEDLDPETNLLVNGTLNSPSPPPDLGGDPEPPRAWAWDDETGITGQQIDPKTWTFTFDIADEGVHNLQQTSAVGTVAPGDVAPFAFDAWVETVVVGYTSVGAFDPEAFDPEAFDTASSEVVAPTARMQAVVEYLRADGTTQVGEDQSGGLVTLTPRPKRIAVTPDAAGALTSRARVSLQIDNIGTVSVRVHVQCAQLEIGPEPTLFIAAPEPVAFNPEDTSQASRIYPVFIHGSVRTPGTVKAVADAEGLEQLIVHRETQAPGYVAQFPLHASLVDGTLGADTTDEIDFDAVGNHAALVTYTSPDPDWITVGTVHGTGPLMVIPAPPDVGNGQIQVGDLLEVWTARLRYRTKVTAPRDWKVIPDPQHSRANDRSSFSDTLVLWGFFKIADADDVAALDFTFNVLGDEGDGGSFIAALQVWRNIDQLRPLESVQYDALNNDDNPRAPGVTPQVDGDAISFVFAGAGDTGVLTFDNPGGSTPTLTERVQQTSDATFHALAIFTGVLALAQDTEFKQADASIPIDAVMATVVWRKAPSGMARRSRVEMANLQPGVYEMLVRYNASRGRGRLRFEYATESDPSNLHHLIDYIYDTQGASEFGYDVRSVGMVSIPEDYDLEALTIDVSSGLETLPATSPIGVTPQLSAWHSGTGDKSPPAFTPAIGDLIVAFAPVSGIATPPTVTDDQGGTYTKVTDALHNTSANIMAFYVRDELVTDAVPTTLTMSSPGENGGGIFPYTIRGVSRSGLDAIRQSGRQQNQAAGTPAPVFPGAVLETSVVLGGVMTATNGTDNCVEPDGWTESFDEGYSGPNTGFESCWRNAGETGTTITFGGATPSVFASIVVEIDISLSPMGTLLLDHLWLAPCNEIKGVMTATRQLLEGEALIGDADRNRVDHLGVDGKQRPMGTAEGPVPMMALPGWDALHITPLQDRLAGHLDRQASLDAAPVISFPYTRRERI